ncbi:hypothetical protein ZWY2020_008563, partial [Hordeum vulgare]
CRGPQPGGSSCWATGAAAWSSSQQKRQRCERPSWIRTSASVQMSEPELPDTTRENEEEDYYMDDDDDDDCDDDSGDDSEYEFDEADFNQQLADKFDDLDLPQVAGWASDELAEDEITKKYKAFQQFYTVEKFSDHHLLINKQEWTKKIQHDWKLLEKDLPASIFVRVAEDRMDLLRAAIIGPERTPTMMPSWYLGWQWLREVELSSLNHAAGACVHSGSHLLNEKPYFNEQDIIQALRIHNWTTAFYKYNKTTFLHSCETMLYSLRRPRRNLLMSMLDYLELALLFPQISGSSQQFTAFCCWYMLEYAIKVCFNVFKNTVAVNLYPEQNGISTRR